MWALIFPGVVSSYCHQVNLHFYLSHSSTSTQTSLGQGGQGNWGLDCLSLVETKVMEKLCSKGKRNQNNHWRTWTRQEGTVHQRNLHHPLVGRGSGKIREWTLSNVKEDGPILSDHGDRHFPRSTERYF